jgi:hypothetical protein
VTRLFAVGIGSRAVLLALPVALGACGCRSAPLRLGDLPTARVATISEICSKPKRFAGETVELRGRVTRVCQHVGCWLYVADQHAELYVDLQNGLRFVVPRDSSGRQARVVGTVEVNSGDPVIVARGVELR